MFQSLFFWIWRSGRRGYRARPWRSVGGFNPCFSGSGALALTPEHNEYIAPPFQSLFFWIWRSGQRGFPALVSAENVSILVFLDLALWPGRTGPAVGPHYPVSILVFLDLALWLVVRGVHYTRIVPVSILVFLDLALWRELAARITNAGQGFQSLFFWIWRSGSERGVAELLVYPSFQSLFFWIWRSGHQTASHPSARILVSILVFLDLALWPSPLGAGPG